MSTAPPGLAGRHFWERTVLGWHLAFAAMIVVAVFAALTDGEVSAARGWVVLGLGAWWVIWYVAMGAPSLVTGAAIWRARS